MQPRNRENGAALLFLAISLLAILSMIALGIDSMNILSASRNSQFSANMVALAALEEFFRNSSDTTPVRLEKATARARTVAQSNRSFYQSSPKVNEGDSGMKLIPGRWVQPLDSNGNATGSAYFAEYKDGQPIINAFRVTGSAISSTRLILLGSILRMKAPNVATEAIATVAPRRAMFLVDLSSTVVIETYIDRLPSDQQIDPAAGRGAAYGFMLAGDNPSVAGRNWHDPAYWDVVNNATNRLAAPADEQSNPLIHFKDDYKKIALLNDTDYRRNAAYVPTILKLHPDPAADSRFAVGNARVYARVDGFRDGVHLGPQPLRNILTGIRTIVSEFKARRVYGDKVGVIFFDENTDWRRIILPTDNFDYVLEALTFDTASQLTVDDPAAITASGLDPSKLTGINLSSRLALFPQPSANTNLILPLSYATEFLAADTVKNPGIKTTDFVVVATDGFSNCLPQATGGYLCNDIYEYYRDSMAILKGSVTNQYVQSAIPIHVMLTGAIGAPHTLNAQKSSTDPRCASDTDLRLSGRRNVAALDPSKTYEGWAYATYKVNSYAGKSAQWPYRYVNEDWYDIALQTRGIWHPIRPVQPGCVPLDEDRVCPPGVSWQLTDPQCLSAEQQTVKAAKKILGQNPYIIVKTLSDNYVSK